MKIKTYSKEELENMPYDDLAYTVLREKGKKMKTMDIFKAISDSLGLDERQYEDKIADFFTLLSTEKRFIQLPKGYWDLKENHTSNVTIDEVNEESEEDDEIEDLKQEPDEEVNEEDYYDSNDDEDASDDLQDLVIIDEDTEEE